MLNRGLFCNRTLNLRAIRAIGYDMDYTLIHYHVMAWEERAYSYIKKRLNKAGWPVESLQFKADLVMRGLIIDTELGNIVKADRFGYVKYAFHGTTPLDYDEKKRVYRQTLVDLNTPRWKFLNTLFSLSEACMYMQLVDLIDSDVVEGVMGYGDLYNTVRQTLDEAHMEGKLKEEIINNPAEFVDLDPEIPLALLDQKYAGKKLLLITNSEWSYAAPMLAYAFDQFLPGKMTWKDLFDISIVAARKPDFFSLRLPAFEVVDDDGLLREHSGSLKTGKVYVGGNAKLVEESLGITGEDILYVGDHIFADVNVSKSIQRWRTALIIRELEGDIAAAFEFEDREEELGEMMVEKERLEADFSRLRLRAQRIKNDYSTDPSAQETVEDLDKRMMQLRQSLVELDGRISPIAIESSRLNNPNWGLLMRTGKDKSHLARQIERYADIYMSRVSDFLYHTPFVYLRSHRGSLPHDLASPITHIHERVTGD
ncbi:MAG: HAD-IG family 5'-nucleotidase [Rhodothermales bacterium]|nr:HAD-IG family 5'-nucleotidase [Rhodothermales bacterium]